MQINSETDFVARNEKFMSMVSAAAQAALDSKAGTLLIFQIWLDHPDCAEMLKGKCVITMVASMNLPTLCNSSLLSDRVDLLCMMAV